MPSAALGLFGDVASQFNRLNNLIGHASFLVCSSLVPRLAVDAKKTRTRGTLSGIYADMAESPLPPMQRLPPKKSQPKSLQQIA